MWTAENRQRYNRDKLRGLPLRISALRRIRLHYIVDVGEHPPQLVSAGCNTAEMRFIVAHEAPERC
jgi:hypothetical protein